MNRNQREINYSVLKAKLKKSVSIEIAPFFSRFLTENLTREL